jgi:UDP-apiose/xylose synthase
MAGSETGRVCILGGGGFLGSRLVERLIEETRFDLEAIDTSFDRLSVTSKRLVRTRADIAGKGVLESAVDRSDTIVSTTAMCNPSQYNTRPVEVIHANFTHLVPLVDLCAKHRCRLVHFSTCEVYGNPHENEAESDSRLQEDITPLVLGPVSKERWSYACAKQLLERLIWAHGAHGALDFTIVRPFNVIGPRMDFIPGVDGEGVPRVLACFMQALLLRDPLQLVAGGSQRRSFVYLDDFVEAVLRILQRPEPCRGQIINIGHPGNELAISELADRMIAVYREITSSPHRFETRAVTAEEFYGPGYDDSERRIPDIEKARQLLDWEPVTSLEQMLPIIIQDYIDRYQDRMPGRGDER